MPTTKHFIVKVKRPVSAQADKVVGQPKPTPKPAPKTKEKKPKGPAQTPPKTPGKLKPRDALRSQGLDFYHFVWPIDVFDHWCHLLADSGASRPNDILLGWIQSDIEARELQKLDKDSRKDD
jgi:hypothetical protein